LGLRTDVLGVKSENPQFSSWLVASLRCAVVAIDSDGVVAELNTEAQRILGCPAEGRARALGRACEEVLAAQPEVAELLLSALAGNEQPARTELTMARDLGEGERTVGYTLCAVRSSDDRIRGAALLFRDLSSIERVDEQERLQGRLAVLGEMAAGLAHEIRNPLAGMQVLGGLLKRRIGEGSEESSLLDGIVAEARHIEAVVSRVLDFVRSSVPVQQELDVSEVLEPAIERALARIPFKGRVIREYSSSLPTVLGDRGQLAAVFGDVVVNALQAMAEIGDDAEHCLTLATSHEKSDMADEVVVSIADTGAGVPRELRERVFYPFFTTKEVGHGIGLASAQKVVANHGGTLEIAESTPRGALVHIRLPIGGGVA
jgi:nitrogen-specific signal transduction histidine kinase